MSDPELIQGVLRRDRSACQFLVDRFQNKVIILAYHFLGCMEDAEDLSQEIFVEIIRSMHTFRQHSSLETWISRITINKALNQVKRKRRREIFQRLEGFFSSTGQTILHEPAQKEIIDEQSARESQLLLHAALAKLPDNQRIAFVLHNMDDQPYKEIANIMNVSLSSVESLIHRAKQNLRISLAKHFPEYQKRAV